MKEDRKKNFTTIDGNEAVASVAYRLQEVIAIYPITPASAMGEWADAWAAEGRPNIWGTVPMVVELQSEGGAAGAMHGALQGGALTTSFTSSQGLLLMIPNMYKIAGELTSMVLHVAARSLAAQALSIFGDHSDVMATRATGFALLCSASVQEAMDFALLAQAATLRTRVPFLHFFDGFRTSHEVAKVEMLSDDDLRALVSDELVHQHRSRALSPDHPVIRGTAQNPDVYFQTRERANPYYQACSAAVQQAMDQLASRTGRQYRLFEYYGAPDAQRVIVAMGSGCETVHETVDYLNQHGAKVGVVKVRLFRPFENQRFVEALPATTQTIAVLDRTKEPGSAGDPLYLDCVNALYEASREGYSPFKQMPTVIAGRYGLSSKEFTPGMVKAIFDNLTQGQPKNHFTVGIHDDVTATSLSYDPAFFIEPKSVFRGLFYGLGADGTVGANKNSIKIIGENTENYAQGYFVYDSKKSGAITISHLRFGMQPIHAAYLISQKAQFVACHQSVFWDRYDMLRAIDEGGTFLLNTPYQPSEVWGQLPNRVQEQILSKKLSVYCIDAYKVARESGLTKEISTVMQVCFFALAGVLPREQAIAEIKSAIYKTFIKKGQKVVDMNLKAVDNALQYMSPVPIGDHVTSAIEMRVPVAADAPSFVHDVLGEIIAGRGDDLPVSAFPEDGTFPVGTAKWEKRNLAMNIPVWDQEICIECGKCAMICPHAVIRMKVYDSKYLETAPATWKFRNPKDKDWKELKYTIQVSPEDCTECGLCVEICPAKSKTVPDRKSLYMQPLPPLRQQEKENWNYFLSLPELDRRQIKTVSAHQQQVQQPLFEFSGACTGCGETPYLKLLSQLFGDRAIIANATGCSSIFGGNLPTTPWTKNTEGRGPAWANSLFEDNAEFGFGLRVALDKQKEYAQELLKRLAGVLGDNLADAILTAPQKNESDIYEQRQRVAALKQKLLHLDGGHAGEAQNLLTIADSLVTKTVWIVGGDGWAYDIGYGGLDHVLASGRKVNILVLDTEVYSNTGGQMSKATPRGAVARFAASGKRTAKKDLGLLAMTYGTVYVASVAMGARDEQTLKAFMEAERYEGTSLIIAYCHCIAHGIDFMNSSLEHQKAAVNSGQWLLYRYDPGRARQNENPLQLDSKAPNIPLQQYMELENRFRSLGKTHPGVAKQLADEAQNDVNTRWALYQYLANQTAPATPTTTPAS